MSKVDISNGNWKLWFECGKIYYSSDDSDRKFFYNTAESGDNVEVFLWSDSTFHTLPEIQVPVTFEQAPVLQTSRQWKQGRIAALAAEVARAARNDENISFEVSRELDDLISDVRTLLPK